MLILASASPRRRQLLHAWGIPHRVIPSRLTEPAPRPTETPVRYARRLALLKTLAIAKRVVRDGTRNGSRRELFLAVPSRRLSKELSRVWVLGADTIVVAGRHILGKPRNVADAERMLRRLSGTTHRVITAVALVQVMQGVRPGGWPPTGLSLRPGGGHPPGRTSSTVRHAVSRVTMRRLTPAEIARYARHHRDKAGAYAVQDASDSVVSRIEGSYTNVVGLPKEIILPLLRRAGL